MNRRQKDDLIQVLKMSRSLAKGSGMEGLVESIDKQILILNRKSPEEISEMHGRRIALRRQVNGRH